MLIMVLFYCQNITQGWYTAMLTNTKILIADEDLRSRRSIKDALVKNGYRFVEEAENGEEAILAYKPDTSGCGHSGCMAFKA